MLYISLLFLVGFTHGLSPEIILVKVSKMILVYEEIATS